MPRHIQGFELSHVLELMGAVEEGRDGTYRVYKVDGIPISYEEGWDMPREDVEAILERASLSVSLFWAHYQSLYVA